MLRSIAHLRRAVALVERALGVAVALLVVGLAAVVVGQIIDRHFWRLPMDAPDQYVRVGIVWLTFIGFALAIADRSAIRVDLIDHWLSPRARGLLAAACDAMMLAMATIVAIKGWRVVEVGAGQYLLGTPFTAALPNAGLFVGAVLMAVFLAARLAARLAPDGDAARARDSANDAG